MSKITKHALHEPAGAFDLAAIKTDVTEGKDQREYRALKTFEIEWLTSNGNSSSDWSQVLVSDPLCISQIRNSHFSGRVRLGMLREIALEYGSLRLPAGIYNSMVVACDIGDNVAIHHGHYLANYVIGDESILFNIGRLTCSPQARFGIGGLHEGEKATQRQWLEVGNGNGGRGILAYPGMTAADAWLCAKYRGDKEMLNRLTFMTDHLLRQKSTGRGIIGKRSIIRGCQAMIDVNLGPDACIDGALRLENLTIRSSANENTTIGDGVILTHGIVGYGCQVDQSSQAEYFVLGNRAQLHQGVRVAHAFVGDNSKLACGEVQNALLFPFHEQHHNNSFLIAATLLGQSNLAAGATVGSNHSSRLADGEILAGRGFWPALCSSFKHPCRFASFTLAVKADYPYELDIRLPFSLISNDEQNNRLNILPAYWFLYNPYALARNDWKFRTRDKRIHREQKIEYDHLAPDTVEEMFVALELLALWTGRAANNNAGDDDQARQLGRDLLRNQPDAVDKLTILAEGVENSKRPVVVLKAAKAYAAYRKMIHYYATQTLVQWTNDQGMQSPVILSRQLRGVRVCEWVNLGGQLATRPDVDLLRQKIKTAKLESWAAVHEEYEHFWEKYPLDKARHAYASLMTINELESGNVSGEMWVNLLRRGVEIQHERLAGTISSREKDFTSPFRKMLYADEAEMFAVLGRPEDDSIINIVRQETTVFCHLVDKIAQLEKNATPSED